MRVRISRSLAGNIDGIELGRFSPGFVYEVGPALGAFLLAERMAEPDDSGDEPLILPVEELFFHPENPEDARRATANDRAGGKRRKRRI